MHQRVVLQVYLLTLVLVEIRAQLVEFIGEHKLVVGDGERIGAASALFTAAVLRELAIMSQTINATKHAITAMPI